MFTESKVTEIYCMSDDFCKEFTSEQKNIWLQISIVGIVTSPIV